MSESGEISPRRIGSFQSWNGPLTVELVGDVVMVGDGSPGFGETAGRDVGDSGGSSIYHKLDAP